jgi:hypothetical protein
MRIQMSVKTLDWLLLTVGHAAECFELLHNAGSETCNIFGGIIFSTTQMVLLYTNYTVDTVVIITDKSVAKWLRKEEKRSKKDKFVLTMFIRNVWRGQKHSRCNILYSLFYIFHSVHYNSISTIVTNIHTKLLLDLQ